MKLSHTALAVVTTLALAMAPLAQAEARGWHHGGGGWHHGHGGGYGPAIAGGLIGALTLGALLAPPARAVYVEPAPVYAPPPYYVRERVYYPEVAYYEPPPV